MATAFLSGPRCVPWMETWQKLKQCSSVYLTIQDRKLRNTWRATDLSKRWAGWQHQLQPGACMPAAKQMLVVASRVACLGCENSAII